MRTWRSSLVALAAGSLLRLYAFGQSVPALINYQGRLTDQGGTPLAPGSYGIQFRLWDSPTATATNDLVWGQQQTVTVQSNGVFNVILGSPGGSPIPGATPAVNDLSFAFTSSNRYLGLSVAASNGAPIPSAIEILPRQQLLSVPFALVASTAGLASVASNAMVAASVPPGTITADSLASNAVQTTNLADGSVSLAKLAPRAVGTNVGVGGVAISLSCGSYPPTNANLVVQITTTGRPVYVGLISDQTPTAHTSGRDSYIDVGSGGGNAGSTTLSFVRDQTVIAKANAIIGINASGTANNTVVMPPGSFNTIDLAPPGTHTYSVSVTGQGYLDAVQLFAFEL